MQKGRLQPSPKPAGSRCAASQERCRWLRAVDRRACEGGVTSMDVAGRAALPRARGGWPAQNIQLDAGQMCSKHVLLPMSSRGAFIFLAQPTASRTFRLGFPCLSRMVPRQSPTTGPRRLGAELRSSVSTFHQRRFRWQSQRVTRLPLTGHVGNQVPLQANLTEERHPGLWQSG